MNENTCKEMFGHDTASFVLLLCPNRSLFNLKGDHLPTIQLTKAVMFVRKALLSFPNRPLFNSKGDKLQTIQLRNAVIFVRKALY